MSDWTAKMSVADVVVVGGGVAGVSAAIELAERGLKVTVLERADTLGGKVKGWRDSRGDSLEGGLHGWSLDYTNFRDLLKRVGVTGNLTVPTGPLAVIHQSGVVDRLMFSRWPSPFHSLSALRGLNSVGWRGKLSTVRAGFAMVSFDPNNQDRGLDHVDFYTWMRRQGVSYQAARAVFEPVLRRKLFLPTEQISAAAGINTIWLALRRRESWQFSRLRGNTNDYLWEPLASHLEKYGGKIRLGTRATGFRLDGNRVQDVLVSEEGRDPRPLHTDYVVLATDIESCMAIIRGSLDRFGFFRNIFNLTGTDALVTRTWFQGDVDLSYQHAMLVGYRIVDAFLDVTRFQPEMRRVGTLVIETQSYLGKLWMQTPDATIRDLVLRDLVEVLPELEDSRPVKTVVIRHRGLVSAFGLGSNAYRPTSSTPLANLYMAGDWVRAPEPVMFVENAVVTGRRAASAILERENCGSVPIVPLPPTDTPIRVCQRIGRAVRRAKRGFRRIVGFDRIGEGGEA